MTSDKSCLRVRKRPLGNQFELTLQNAMGRGTAQAMYLQRFVFLAGEENSAKLHSWMEVVNLAARLRF